MRTTWGKYLILFTIILIVIGLTTAASAEAGNIKVVLDGKEVTFPDQQPFINENDRTMVPVRFVSEAMGAVVRWDQITKTVTIVQDGTTILLKMDESQANVNGRVKPFDTKAILTNSRMMVPLRFVSEVLGANVDYVNDKKVFTVYVVTKSKAPVGGSSSGSGSSNSGGYLLSETLRPSEVRQTVGLVDQVELVIPAGFSQAPEVLKIKKLADVTASNETEFEYISDIFDIELGDNEFDENIFIELTYNPEEVDENEGIFAGYLDESADKWVIVPAAIDNDRKVVIIPTNHLSTWTVLTIEEGKAANEVITAPLNLDFVEYLMADETIDSGYIPSTLDFDFTNVDPISASAYTDPLPAAYNSIAGIQYQTSAKDQIVSGPCWSFATFGALESSLLKNSSTTYDFSERNLMNNHGYDFPYTGGGNRDLAMGYLTRWYGPVLETDDIAFNPPSSATNGYMPDKVRQHVQDVFYIPDKDYDAIKRSVREYGAVYSTMRWGTDYTYYNFANNAFYYNGASNGDHAILIVGWDDNFSRTNFNIQPPGDGAFIIKNSWGTGFGANGYFYISYYDSIIGKENFAFTNVQATTNYAHKYEYDPLGWTASAGYGYNNNTAWFANVFTANHGTNEKLKAVAFYTMVPNSSYEIHVNSNFAGGSPSGLVKVKQGTIATPGYHTIVLDSPIDLTINSKFIVAVKLTSPGVGYPVPVELQVGGYSTAASSALGQSYLSSTGAFWSDLAGVNATANVCIKAFTDDGTATAQLAFGPTSYSVAENGGSVNLTVNRTGSTSGILTLDYATTNDTATAGTDYTAASGTLTFADGEASKTIAVTVNDDGVYEGNETFKVTLSNPSSGSISGATATVTIVENDSVISFDPTTYTVDESGGNAAVTVKRTGVTTTAVTADFATVDGTAQAGLDYTATSGSLTFASGVTSQVISVPVINDSMEEADENFTIALSNPTNGANIGNGTATVNISANDVSIANIAFDPATYLVAENGGSITLTVQRSSNTSGVLTVDYATSNGTATEGSDYTGASGTLSFADGEAGKIITVPILDDGVYEGNENFTVTLSNASTGNITSAAATVTITENDTLPEIQFSAASYFVAEDAGTATITVLRTGDTSDGTTVNYATSNGSALAGSDYTAVSGTLSFAPGETSKTFSVSINDDASAEGSETLSLTLTNPTGAILGVQKTAVITISDNEAPGGTVTGVTLVSPASWGASLKVGGTLNAILHATYSEGGTVDVTTLAQWSSSYPAVATVTAGQITGIASGSTLITATYNNHKVQFTMVVRN